MRRPAGRDAEAARRTAEVVRHWPVVPFWRKRRADAIAHLALPGAAVSGAATIAALLFEPAIHWPAYTGIPLDFLGESTLFAMLSVLAPLATVGVLDRPGGNPLFRGAGWLGLLPVWGLFTVARELAAADRERTGLARQATVPLRIELAHRHRPRTLFPTLIGAARRGFRGGMLWQAVLFGSHLGWLIGAVAYLKDRAGARPAFACGLLCLHLLAMAAAWLMMRHEQRRRTLMPDGWTNRVVPWVLLLPLPLNALAIPLWLRPRTREARSSLASSAFGAEGPLHRLPAFRRANRGHASFQGFVHGWTGDPLRPVAEPRQRREELWTELHRIALFFQVLFLVDRLTAAGVLAWDAVTDLLMFLAGAMVLAGLARLVLLVGHTAIEASRGKTAAFRLSGIAFVLVLAISAAAFLPAPPAQAVAGLSRLFCAAAILLLLLVGCEIVVARSGLRILPRPLIRAIGLALAGLLIGLSAELVQAANVMQVFEVMAAGSLLLSPLLAWLAWRLDAPVLVRSRWLLLPFSALLLPILPARNSC